MWRGGYQVEYFAVFDPDGTNLVFVLEVIMMVLLFCHGTWQRWRGQTRVVDRRRL